MPEVASFGQASSNIRFLIPESSEHRSKTKESLVRARSKGSTNRLRRSRSRSP